jgi:hypothetical protein
MVMPIYMSLVVPYLISAPVGNLTASGNGDLIVFSPFVAAARSYISPVYIALDF